MTTETITIDTDKWTVVPREATDKMAKYGAVAAMLHYESDAIRCYAAMLEAAPRPVPVQADEMVSRFLSWKLPEDFAPDCHISFDLAAAKSRPQSWPIGTNLFTAAQAKEMVLHMLKKHRLEEGERATKAVAALIGAFDGIGAGRKARRDDREVLSVIEEPRPVPTSERLPTEADADCEGFVRAFNVVNEKWYLYRVEHVVEDGNISHWQPTGLQRPPATGEEG